MVRCLYYVCKKGVFCVVNIFFVRDCVNLCFVDVENFGRVDIIWFNKYIGVVSVWKNNGYVGFGGGGGGSFFFWIK